MNLKKDRHSGRVRMRRWTQHLSVLAQERRMERLRIFGYVRLANGECLSLSEATRTIAGGEKGKEVVEYHPPEAYHDVIDSYGETDAVGEYPFLGIYPGVVLVDKKMKHRDPALSYS